MPRRASGQGDLKPAPSSVQSDANALATRAAAWLQQVRETGDPALYVRADAALSLALRLEPENLNSLVLRGGLELSRHQFRAALELGRAAHRLYPRNAGAMGVVVDALVELGRYDEAVAAVDSMAALRPDQSSCARVAYLRELMGDLDGAAAAMRQAVTAGAPSGENTAWCLLQLGHLEFGRGNLAEAAGEYQAALTCQPGYAPALAGLGRIRASEGHLDSALVLLRTASDRLPLPDHVIALGDVLQALGRRREAQDQYRLVTWMEGISNRSGVDSDMEMALFCADHGLDLPRALERARKAETDRPSVRASDVLAWTLYCSGHAAEAAAPMQRALRLGTQDASMWYHAGMIRLAAGDSAGAREALSTALRLNPHFSLPQAPRAVAALASLSRLP